MHELTVDASEQLLWKAPHCFDVRHGSCRTTDYEVFESEWKILKSQNNLHALIKKGSPHRYCFKRASHIFIRWHTACRNYNITEKLYTT